MPRRRVRVVQEQDHLGRGRHGCSGKPGEGKAFRSLLGLEPGARLLREIEDLLRRLQTSYIDLYQVHWPDPLVPVEETADLRALLYRQGKIRALGVSNYSPPQLERFRAVAPLHTVQPPDNLFERAIEREVLPYSTKITFGVGGEVGSSCAPIAKRHFVRTKAAGMKSQSSQLRRQS